MTIGEFEWIDRLAAILRRAGAAGEGSVARGRPAIGDDAAVLEGPGGEAWAWTVDTLVEGVHFRFDWLEAADVGHRALAASLSDLAATGATPAGALVAAAGPAETFAERIEGIYAGMAELAARAGCPILGGDLSRAEGSLHLTVTALGRVEGGAPLGRSGARPGDALWVTGELGAPAAAVALLQAAGRAGLDPRTEVGAHPALTRLARPEPRTAEVAWLRNRAEIRAAIDVSDGVSGDAGHLARRSGVRVVLDPALVPLHPATVRAAAEFDGDALEWALHGGEEFELLLAAPDGALDPLAGPFAAEHGIPLTRIGTIEAGDGVHLREDGGTRPLPARSWDHFA
ncbi:MAG TPA: thiamine-phosphate kinase [Gemmatimonadota bacterium]|nr:thiamine-phosphate kinase [Gemmatimonadota bacterium]